MKTSPQWLPLASANNPEVSIKEQQYLPDLQQNRTPNEKEQMSLHMNKNRQMSASRSNSPQFVATSLRRGTVFVCAVENDRGLKIGAAIPSLSPKITFSGSYYYLARCQLAT
jgi:hypothetical protein